MNMYDPAREASAGPDLGVVMEPSEQSATAETQARKFVRHQVLDKRSYNADELRATLQQRAFKSGSAKHWGSLSVDTITIEEED
jgi:hypothetical protein